MISADGTFPRYRAELNRHSGNRFSNRSFPPKTGIPGYCGFIDSMNSLLVTPKPNLREPLDFAPPAENLQKQALKTQEATLRSATYTADYTAQPESYSGPFTPGKPGGTAAATLPVAQPVQARGGEASALGDSLALSDTGGPAAAGGGGTKAAHSSSGPPPGFRGFSGVESTYRGHFPMRAQTAPADASRPAKQDIMFQTTYGNHFGVDSDAARTYRDQQDPLGFRPLTAAAAAAGTATSPAPLGAAASASAASTNRQSAAAQQQGQPQPRLRQFLEDKSTYREDFSLRPLDRNAPIRAGTVKQTNHVASYCGFIPASKQNPAALRQSLEPSGARTSAEQREGARLLTLDQYSRLRPPNYGGYRPQAPPNTRVFDPPTSNLATTAGRSEFYSTMFEGRPAKSAGPNADLPRVSMLSFFTPGKTAVSDNGITNAQSFYVGCRPNEGMPQLFRAPSTTYYGKRFAPQGVTTFQ